MSFKSVQKKISRSEGIPMKNAGAILAHASRNASPAAKKANPNLMKVKGSEYSNKHAGSHALTQSHGALMHGMHKACK